MMRTLRGALVALVAVGGCTINQGPEVAPALAAPSASAAPAPPRQKRACVLPSSGAQLIAPDDASAGDEDALVTVLAFGDYQDVFSAKLGLTLARVREAYEPSKVRIVWKHMPLSSHELAEPAALLGVAVHIAGGDDAFWAFHRRAVLDGGRPTPEGMLAWIEAAGLRDADGFVKVIDGPDAIARLERDMTAARKIHLVGVPHVFVNGTEIAGAYPFNRFKEVLDREIARVSALPPAERGFGPSCAAMVATAQARKPPERKAAEQVVHRVPVGKSPARGPDTAKVTIVEFGDYEDQYTRRAQGALLLLQKAYGDKIRIIWKDNPLGFHKRALAAATLSREVRAQKGDEAFWKAHDRLLSASRELPDEELEAIANEAGVAWAGVKAAIEKRAAERAIDVDQDLADDLDVGGTPTFFVNGRKLVGSQRLPVFTELIDEELKKADEALAKGVAAASLYDELTKGGKAPVGPTKVGNAPEVPKGAPFRGAEKATVVMQEFSDFQCPFCRRVEPVLAELLEQYKGKLKVVWRHKPLESHPQARIAAEASAEAFAQKGQKGFWAMHDALFSHQKEAGGLEKASLLRYAREQGLDVTRFEKALDEHVHAGVIDGDIKASEAAKVNSTPTFFINGYVVAGAGRVGRFRRVIELALKEK